MHIYADPTELRPGTRLSKSVVLAVEPLPGLEKRTGGDFLITPLEKLLVDVTRDTLPVRRALEAHFNAGAVLVARKSGTDLLNSLADLKGVLMRMLEWAGPGAAWLLHTGTYVVEDGFVAVDGWASKVKPKQVEGALFWWERRGGHVKHLDNDDQIGAWLNEMLEYSRQVMEEPIRHVVHAPAQKLARGKRNWVTTGMAFPPGVGLKKRRALRDSLKADGLEPWLSNAVYRATTNQVKVPGFGKVLVDRCREWCGFEEEQDANDL